MTADELRALPEVCDPAGVGVGWVALPMAQRDALADLIDAAGEMPIHGSDPAVSYCFICKNDAPCATERAQLAVAALEAQ